MINPGTMPLQDASEDLAAEALGVFLAAVRARADEMGAPPIRRTVGAISSEPVRDAAADRDGRFGWDLPFTDGTVVRLLVPGVQVPAMRDDITAEAPCLYVDGVAWWWSDAVSSIAATSLRLA